MSSNEGQPTVRWAAKTFGALVGALAGMMALFILSMVISSIDDTTFSFFSGVIVLTYGAIPAMVLGGYVGSRLLSGARTQRPEPHTLLAGHDHVAWRRAIGAAVLCAAILGPAGALVFRLVVSMAGRLSPGLESALTGLILVGVVVGIAAGARRALHRHDGRKGLGAE